MKPSKSPERNTFQLNAYIERCKEEGTEPREDYIQLYTSADELDEQWAVSNDHSHDLEWDLRTTQWMLDKVRASDVYAQNLYAAMCNNDFQKLDVFPILADKTCSYSWRYAGGIIADMQMKGDYINWYCSGIRGSELDDDQFQQLTTEQRELYIESKDYVPESVVTDEVRADLKKLGWKVLDNENDNF